MPIALAQPTCPSPSRYNRPQCFARTADVLPRVHPTAFIDDSAQVIGDVEIGEESSVWMCAVIRGDVHWIRIGRRSNIQDGTVVHVMTGTHPTTHRRQRDDRPRGGRSTAARSRISA